MHRSPILAYFFELSGMSRQTFALADLAQVNSVESWTWFSPTSSLSVRHLQFVCSDFSIFQVGFLTIFILYLSGTHQELLMVVMLLGSKFENLSRIWTHRYQSFVFQLSALGFSKTLAKDDAYKTKCTQKNWASAFLEGMFHQICTHQNGQR